MTSFASPFHFTMLKNITIVGANGQWTPEAFAYIENNSNLANIY